MVTFGTSYNYDFADRGASSLPGSSTSVGASGSRRHRPVWITGAKVDSPITSEIRPIVGLHLHPVDIPELLQDVGRHVDPKLHTKLGDGIAGCSIWFHRGGRLRFNFQNLESGGGAAGR